MILNEISFSFCRKGKKQKHYTKKRKKEKEKRRNHVCECESVKEFTVPHTHMRNISLPTCP